MIVVKELYKSFKETPLFEGINLQVNREILGIIGANGTGKTTFFKCLLGLIPYKGVIEMGGVNIQTSPLEAKKKIGYIPQYLPLWPDLTILEVLRFFCRLRKVPLHRGEELLEEFDLGQHQKKKIAFLSGGMRQKFSIIIALLSDPEILLLDEPTASLDNWATKEILSILESKKEQKCILFASHRLEEVRAISNRVLQLHQKKLVSPNWSELSFNG